MDSLNLILGPSRHNKVIQDIVCLLRQLQAPDSRLSATGDARVLGACNRIQRGKRRKSVSANYLHHDVLCESWQVLARVPVRRDTDLESLPNHQQGRAHKPAQAESGTENAYKQHLRTLLNC